MAPAHAARIILSLVLGLLLLGNIGAQGKRYAILVGVGDYADSSILKLATPRNDVADLAASLSKAGWDKVFSMSDSLDYRNADFPSRSNIIKKASLLADLARTEDTILLFFSGHGMTDAGEQYFLPVDADLGRLKDSSVNLEAVLSPFRNRGLDKVVLALDACREAVSKTKGISLVGLGGSGSVSGGPALALYATQAGWYSFEDPRGRNGVFTNFLLQGLAGNADGALGGAKPDGTVTFGELAAWLPEAVGSWALDNGKRQKPYSTAPSPAIAALGASRPGVQASLQQAVEKNVPVRGAFEDLSAEQARQIKFPDPATLTSGQKLKKAAEYQKEAQKALEDGEAEEALAYYLGAARLDPEIRTDKDLQDAIVDSFAKGVQEFLNEGEASEALDMLDLLIPRFPESAVFYYQRGYTWQELGKYGSAVTDYRRSQELGNTTIMVDLSIALNLAKQSKHADAELSFKTAIGKQGEERWYALAEYGEWLLAQKRYDESIKRLSESFSLEKRPSILLSKIYAYRALGKKNEAAKEVPQARKLAEEQDQDWILDELKNLGY